VRFPFELEPPQPLPAVLALGIFGAVAAVVFDASVLWSEPPGPVGPETPVTPVIGETFFAEFLSVFEIAAVLLVAALVAAVYLAKPHEGKREAVRRAVEEKPLVDATEAEESMRERRESDAETAPEDGDEEGGEDG